MPVLALNDSKDLQAASGLDLMAAEKGLKTGNKCHVTVQQLGSFNHLIQTAKLGLPSDYSQLAETFVTSFQAYWKLVDCSNKTLSH